MDIKLKRWSLEDKKDLIVLCNSIDRRYLSDRMPYPYTDEDANWWLNMVLEHEGKDGIFRAIIVDNKIVGSISIEQKSGIYKKDAELGYLLFTENWSRGIMTDAVRQICKMAFLELDILRITGLVYSPNIASKRVLEKNGFSIEGTMKKAVFKDNNIYDLFIYGLLKENIEW